MRTNKGREGNGMEFMMRNNYSVPKSPFAVGRAVYTARIIKRILGDSTVYNGSLASTNRERA